MATPDEILAAAEEVVSQRAALKAAIDRFNALLGHGDTTARTKTTKKRGKQPDPNSTAQRVLKAVSEAPGPVRPDEIATLLSVDVKNVRWSLNTHREKGLIERLDTGAWTMKERVPEFVNGAHMAKQNLRP